MIIRSVFFYFLVYLWTIFLGLICLPYLFLPNKYLRKPVIIWINGILEFLKTICKITYEVKGLENIPNHPIIVASKHQSTFETLLLFKIINNSVFIHKKELFLIPIFGLYLKKINMISINRSDGLKSMRKILKDSKEKIKKKHSIIIFPEGTRKKPGEKTKYKTGIIGIYKETESGILPVALNSGFFWPKSFFLKSSGKITIKFLELIPAKLEKNKILKKIESVIEEETNNLKN